MWSCASLRLRLRETVLEKRCETRSSEISGSSLFIHHPLFDSTVRHAPQIRQSHCSSANALPPRASPSLSTRWLIDGLSARPRPSCDFKARARQGIYSTVSSKLWRPPRLAADAESQGLTSCFILDLVQSCPRFSRLSTIRFNDSLRLWISSSTIVVLVFAFARWTSLRASLRMFLLSSYCSRLRRRNSELMKYLLKDSAVFIRIFSPRRFGSSSSLGEIWKILHPRGLRRHDERYCTVC